MISLNTYFDKIFYINLDKDVNRNQHMISQFEKWGITNFERVPGVIFEEIPYWIYWRNFNKPLLNKKYILGSLGCRNSHYRVMEISLQRDYNKILVLEDDTIILENPDLILNNNKDILENWDMIYFGGKEEPDFGGQIVCAHAYALNRKLIEETYLMLPSSGMEVDNFYAKVIYHMSYNTSATGKYLIKKMNPFNTIIQDSSHLSNIR